MGFGNFIASPFAGMLLADMGADLIKAEQPSGDMARATPPPSRVIAPTS
ncbi:MAG: CoA transferase [Pseudomonadota bacterium]